MLLQPIYLSLRQKRRRPFCSHIHMQQRLHRRQFLTTITMKHAKRPAASYCHSPAITPRSAARPLDHLLPVMGHAVNQHLLPRSKSLIPTDRPHQSINRLTKHHHVYRSHSYGRCNRLIRAHRAVKNHPACCHSSILCND